MALHPNTSAIHPCVSDVSVEGGPYSALHALILNLFGPYTVGTLEQIRRGAGTVKILPRLLASIYYNKFFTSISSVNTSENTLYFITQRFPIFIQHNAFLCSTRWRQSSYGEFENVQKEFASGAKSDC